jgi:mercuric ion transport protein
MLEQMNKHPAETKTKWLAAGGVLGAIAASSCCMLPLLFVSVGLTGAWIGGLSALAPFKPLVVTATLGVLGYGYYLVYWKTEEACAPDHACARPISTRIVKFLIWVATIVVLLAASFDYIAPLLLNA